MINFLIGQASALLMIIITMFVVSYFSNSTRQNLTQLMRDTLADLIHEINNINARNR